MIARRRLIVGGLALGFASVAPGARARRLGPVTKLPLPRFVSLRSSEVNARRGPGLHYPRDWVFQRAGLPVRVIAEHGGWLRIQDSDEAGGWVYHSLISGRRTVLVTAPEVVLRRRPDETARPTAELRRGVVANLESCAKDWCEIGVGKVEGWAPAQTIWGVGPSDFAAAADGD